MDLAQSLTQIMKLKKNKQKMKIFKFKTRKTKMKTIRMVFVTLEISRKQPAKKKRNLPNLISKMKILLLR